MRRRAIAAAAITLAVAASGVARAQPSEPPGGPQPAPEPGKPPSPFDDGPAAPAPSPSPAPGAEPAYEPPPGARPYGCPPCPEPPAPIIALPPKPQPPIPFRGGVTFGIGIGIGIARDSVQAGSAAGLTFTGRLGWSWTKLALLVDVAGIGTDLRNGGKYSATVAGLLGEYFWSERWSFLAGVGPGGVNTSRDNMTLRDDSGAAFTLGASWEWKRFLRHKSAALQTRLTFLSVKPKDLADQTGSATILSETVVFQLW